MGSQAKHAYYLKNESSLQTWCSLFSTCSAVPFEDIIGGNSKLLKPHLKLSFRMRGVFFPRSSPCCLLRVLIRLKKLKWVNKLKDSFDGTAAAYLSSLQMKTTLLCPTISLSGGRCCCWIWLLSATCVHGAHVYLKSCGSQKIGFYVSSCISCAEWYPESLLTLKLLQNTFFPSSVWK